MVYLTAIVVFSLGLILGLALPDLDGTLRFLTHRSIVTHNFIWPWIPFWLARFDKRPVTTRLRLFAMGLGLALAIHYSFDLFPRSWRGFALIHIPVYGLTEALFSWLWLALSLVICIYLATSLVKQAFDVALLSGGSLVAFALMIGSEPLGRPLAAFTVALVLVMGVDWLKVGQKLAGRG